MIPLLLALCAPADAKAPDRVLTTVTKTLPAHTVQGFVLDQDRGDLIVQGAPVEAITLRVRVLAPRNKQWDTQVLSGLEVDLTWEDGRAHAVSKLDAVDRYTLVTEVLVPEAFPVAVRDESGDVSVQRVGPLTVIDGSGDIDVQHVFGPVEITDGSGSIDVQKVQGSVTVEDGSGDVDLSFITGPVHVQDGSGDVRVSDLDSGVELTDGGGDIELVRVRGYAEIVDGSGEVITESVAEVRLEAR